MSFERRGTYFVGSVLDEEVLKGLQEAPTDSEEVPVEGKNESDPALKSPRYLRFVSGSRRVFRGGTTG